MSRCSKSPAKMNYGSYGTLCSTLLVQTSRFCQGLPPAFSILRRVNRQLQYCVLNSPYPQIFLLLSLKKEGQEKLVVLPGHLATMICENRSSRTGCLFGCSNLYRVTRRIMFEAV